jgi:anthranilate/para-aminobenzoate synthase component I
MSFWAGGGIVADSSMQGEYQESIDKLDSLFNLLEQNESLHYMGGQN